MSTPAQIRFVTRQKGQSFSKHPKQSAIHAQFYRHYDGNPSSLGMDIADSIENGTSINNFEIDRLDMRRGNLDFIYYIWQHPDKETAISIWKQIDSCCPTCGQPQPDKSEPAYDCIFVGIPSDLIEKYNIT